MNRVNALNIYLGNYRKYLLITLNIGLVIFISLEIMVWNEVNGLTSAEEREMLLEKFCEENPSYVGSCNRGGNLQKYD